MRPITEIAASLGLPDELLEPHGRYTAKIRSRPSIAFRRAAAS